MTSIEAQVRAVLAHTAGMAGYERGLDALTVAPAAEVDPVLAELVWEGCAALFRAGWQPVELHRAVARRGYSTHAQLVTDAVAAHLRGFRPATVDPRWRAQADELGAHVWWTGDAGYLEAIRARWRFDRVAALDVVLGLLGTLRELPPVEVLVPPPGTAARREAHQRVDERLLDRVRALLAKAESTGYPAEAETYTAKAQELMARHSIDEALLVARAGDAAVVPFARRIGVDHPYESEKVALLDAVARANRCHVVWSPELGFATVFGFDADLDAVDLLHTSLLLQAHREMSRTEPPGGKAGRTRLRAFRQSFLVAFAVRIGERLARAAEEAVAATADRADLLPVLASRDAQVRETMMRVFPQTVRGRGTRVDSREGWDSGRAAADRASLS